MSEDGWGKDLDCASLILHPSSLVRAMTKTRLTLVAAVVMALVVVAFFWVARAASPGITLQVLKAAPLGDSVAVMCEVRNRTSTKCNLVPLRLETNNGTAWRLCSDGLGGYSTVEDISPEQAGKLICTIRQLPSGTRARLVFQNQRALKGLRSFLLRLKLRLSGQNARLPLNPFDSTVLILSADPVEIVSEAFSAP